MSLHYMYPPRAVFIFITERTIILYYYFLVSTCIEYQIDISILALKGIYFIPVQSNISFSKNL